MPFRPKPQRAITPQRQGRFPGFDVLDQVPYWDDVTAGVVLARLALPNMLSFFTPPRSPSPHRCWICCWGRTASRGSRCCR